MDISNAIDISYIFSGCESLLSLPDISKQNNSKIKDMGFVFARYKSLTIWPDISKWDTSNVWKMSGLFTVCKSLLYLPNIFKWNTSKVQCSYYFDDCINCVNIPINKRLLIKI